MTKRRPAAPQVRPDLPLSMLDIFCRRHNISTPELATVSNISRQQVNRVRRGKADTTLGTAKMLARGASVILRRKVALGELFDLDYTVDGL